MADIDSILNNDLTDVTPDTPLIPEADYVLQIVKIEQKTSDKTGGTFLNIQTRTTEPITALSGEALPVGTTFFGRISISPTEKLTADAIARSLKRFQLACGVTSGPFGPVTQYEGKNVKAHIGFSKKTPEYPDDRNEIKRWVS